MIIVDNPLLAAVFLFVVLLMFMSTSLWVAVSLGITGVIGFLILKGNIGPTAFIPYNSADSFVLTAVPLFIFMGEILVRSQASEGMYRGVGKWLTWLPGGLLHSNIGSCALFAALSGSSVATAAAMGTVAIPALKTRGYDTKLSLGSLAAGGTLGILIPPSITMIVYGMLADTSVGRLFAGGVIPGIILATLFIIYILIRSILNPALAPKEGGFSFKAAIFDLKDVWPALLLVIIVLGGIFGGVFTPTEAAAVGSSAAIVLALLMRKLTWQDFKESCYGAVRTTCMVMFIVASAFIFSSLLGAMTVPKILSTAVVSSSIPPLGVFALVCLLYIFLGCFLDATSMLVMTISTVVPVISSMGFDLVWFGVVIVVLVEIGLLTPPVGLNLFVIQGISKRSLNEVVAGSWPFFIIMAGAIVLFTAFPNIVLWLPNLLFN